LTATTVLSNDLIPKFKKIKILTFLLGIISFSIAFYSPDILFLFKKSYGFFSISLSIPAILSLTGYKINEYLLIIFMFLSGFLALFFPFPFALLISLIFYVINFVLKFKKEELK
ncbi:MAG: hypothetical protein WHV67_09320, partial [Thermoanaerobaculia bacterium]